MDSDTVIAVLSLLISFYTLYTTRKDKQPRLGIITVYIPNTSDGPRIVVAINNQSEHRTQVLDPPYLGHRFTTLDQYLPIGSITGEPLWIDPGEMKYIDLQLDSKTKDWLEVAIKENKKPFVTLNDGKLNWHKSQPITLDKVDYLLKELDEGS